MNLVVGVCGYLLFGTKAHWIILRNLMENCKDIGLFCDLVCLFFVVTTWSAICPLCVRISEFIENHIIFEWLRSRRSRRIRAMKRIHGGYNMTTHQHAATVINTDSKSTTKSISPDRGSEGRSSKRKGTTTTTNLTTSSSRKHASFDEEVVIGDCTKRSCRVLTLCILLLSSYTF